MTDTNFVSVIKATAFSANGTKEEFLAFLSVAEQYGLNPLTKEFMPFQKRAAAFNPSCPSMAGRTSSTATRNLTAWSSLTN
jgi:hypothetical protein